MDALYNPNETVISLQGVSVRYRVPSERIATFKEYVIRLLQGRVKHDEFLALNNLSLDILRGEVFGVIGHNGAGKSTMMKVIARVLPPTRGRAIIKGYVAPLLELGAGFHPELTGRENIYLNGAILGYSHRQMEEKFPGIVEFSELDEFIDAPIRTYSSGMWARLGFAVATDQRPDILLVDEVLAVGDEAFQRKCFDRIGRYREEGTSIIFVSHNMDLVKAMCQRAAWLDHGILKACGNTAEVVQKYREFQGLKQ